MTSQEITLQIRDTSLQLPSTLTKLSILIGSALLLIIDDISVRIDISHLEESGAMDEVMDAITGLIDNLKSLEELTIINYSFSDCELIVDLSTIKSLTIYPLEILTNASQPGNESKSSIYNVSLLTNLERLCFCGSQVPLRNLHTKVFDYDNIVYITSLKCLKILVIGEIAFNDDRDEAIYYEGTRNGSAILDRDRLSVKVKWGIYERTHFHFDIRPVEIIVEELRERLFSSLPNFELLIIGDYVSL